MPKPKLTSSALLASCAIALSGCASPQAHVGECPQVRLPPVPPVVKSTEAKPTGYWTQRLLADLAGP